VAAAVAELHGADISIVGDAKPGLGVQISFSLPPDVPKTPEVLGKFMRGAVALTGELGYFRSLGLHGLPPRKHISVGTASKTRGL
jgi:hypothetical protein